MRHGIFVINKWVFYIVYYGIFVINKWVFYIVYRGIFFVPEDTVHYFASIGIILNFEYWAFYAKIFFSRYLYFRRVSVSVQYFNSHFRDRGTILYSQL